MTDPHPHTTLVYNSCNYGLRMGLFIVWLLIFDTQWLHPSVSSTGKNTAHNSGIFESHKSVQQGPEALGYTSYAHSSMSLTVFTQFHSIRDAGQTTLPGLILGTYNIRYSHGFGLLQALWVEHMGNYDLVLLADTKILDTVYWKNRLMYDVV